MKMESLILSCHGHNFTLGDFELIRTHMKDKQFFILSLTI